MSQFSLLPGLFHDTLPCQIGAPIRNWPIRQRRRPGARKRLAADSPDLRFCCKNLLTIQDVVTSASPSLLQNVAKIFFATEPLLSTVDDAVDLLRQTHAVG